MLGERAFSRTQEKLVVENRLKCVLLNKMIRTAAKYFEVRLPLQLR